MKNFSGRLDMWESEEAVLAFFICLTEKYNCKNIILAFEDKTKTLLSCKPHYHFLFQSDATHDTLRRYISSEPNLKGCFASIKETPDYEKAAVYTLKQFKHQNYIPYFDFDQADKAFHIGAFNEFKEFVINGELDQVAIIDYYINLSEQYQNKITLNSWKDHIKQIIENLQVKYTKKYPSRLELFEYIYEYIYDWNQNDDNDPLNTPPNIKRDISYIEMKILDKKEFMQRMIMDNQHFIYDHEVKEEASRYGTNNYITKFITGNKSDWFHDSDADE